MSSILDQDIKFLPNVGPKTKEILSKELGINSYGDLLEYFPYKYVDRSKIFHISELTPDMPYVQIKGKILSYEERETRASATACWWLTSRMATAWQTSSGSGAPNTF